LLDLESRRGGLRARELSTTKLLERHRLTFRRLHPPIFLVSVVACSFAMASKAFAFCLLLCLMGDSQAARTLTQSDALSLLAGPLNTGGNVVTPNDNAVSSDVTVHMDTTRYSPRPVHFVYILRLIAARRHANSATIFLVIIISISISIITITIIIISFLTHYLGSFDAA